MAKRSRADIEGEIAILERKIKCMRTELENHEDTLAAQLPDYLLDKLVRCSPRKVPAPTRVCAAVITAVQLLRFHKSVAWPFLRGSAVWCCETRVCDEEEFALQV